jgi:hypothetical protein
MKTITETLLYVYHQKIVVLANSYSKTKMVTFLPQTNVLRLNITFTI